MLRIDSVVVTGADLRRASACWAAGLAYPASGLDRSAEPERLLGLGATEMRWPLYPDTGAGFVVSADPDGNRVRVIDR